MEEAATEADTEVATFKADTTKTDEDEENLQDPDDIDSVMETEDAQTIPCPSSDQISPKPLSIPNPNNAASLMEKSDGQIMPNPNSIPTRDQIVPKSLFIPNPDDPVSLMEKAADVTGKDTFTATFTFIVRITEPAPPKPIKQCFKCQKFGHTQYECKQPYTTCSKCAGNHYYKSCTKSRSLPGKCINCGGNHVANHDGCVYMKKALNDLPTNAPARRAEQSLAALNWTEDPAFKGTLQNMMNPPPVRAPFFPTPNFLPNQIDMLRAQYRPMQRQIYQPAQSRDQPFALPPPPNYEY
ncbi:hypothetical protein ACLKA6_012780 [Drosophila palustris]